MKLKVNVATGCLFACRLLSADPPTCLTGTLADYIALGAQGCTLNGDVFANFSYFAGASGGAATITADQVTVTPLVVVPATARFNFSAPWSVAQDQTQDSIIRYTIVPPPGGTASFPVATDTRQCASWRHYRKRNGQRIYECRASECV